MDRCLVFLFLALAGSILPPGVRCAENFTVIVDLLESIRGVFSPEPSDTPILYANYDFIVVGAGTAGSVVASRLSENGSVSVLLIEAGGSETTQQDIPLYANRLQFTDANWNFSTTPQSQACLSLVNGKSKWPRGKVMGGSSVINYMVYTRGHPSDYEAWKSMGNPDWGWDGMLPMFKKVERYQVSNYFDDSLHGNSGRVFVRHVPFRSDAVAPWVNACQQAGYALKGHNDNTQSGVSYVEATIKSGSRWSANSAYLHSMKGRWNAHVIKNSVVTKLILNAAKTRVTGVRVTRKGVQYTINARREVILSAGAINSPKLLMLSGVGPRSDLEALGIPVAKDLPVGYNLKDHIALGGMYVTLTSPLIPYTLDEVLNNFLFGTAYALANNGPFTITGGIESIVYKDFSGNGWADIEFIFLSGTLKSDALFKDNVGMKSDVFDQTYAGMPERNAFTVLPMLLRPKSVGRIRLASTDPMAQPLIDPNYLSHQDDVATLVAGAKEVVRIVQQPALQAHGARLWNVSLPACQSFPFGSDDYWACAARQFTFTVYHPTGTCKMGPVTDPTTVVNSQLKVHGIAGIRVVDSSIMPEEPTAHTNAPAFAIGEKAYTMIKSEWGV